MSSDRLSQKFPETERQREDKIFARYTPSDFVVVRLDDIRNEDYTQERTKKKMGITTY